ncbi:unnamed protein product [Symbiodinium natans]|uniref:Uncharacterized protein n=1 Tax=Symbiodinium natans TaxID=878477 RepID=A0A812R343_9DINO|nr:unnamed protein product [Symbiodinium natans]
MYRDLLRLWRCLRPQSCQIRFRSIFPFGQGPKRIPSVRDECGPGFVPTEENLKQCDEIHRSAIKSRGVGTEGRMTAEFVEKYHTLQGLEKYPYVYLWEWQVPLVNAGAKGDLVLASGDGDFAVVELKTLDMQSSGPTVRRRRTKKREHVEQQAIAYLCLFAQLDREIAALGIVPAVSAWVYTEDGLKNAVPNSWFRGWCEQCQLRPGPGCYPELIFGKTATTSEPENRQDCQCRCQRCRCALVYCR